MRKMMMVLVAVIGLAGLVAVASAHMWDGGHPGRNGYDQGYGWNCGMGPGWMSHRDRMPHMGYGWDHPGRGTSAGPYSTDLLTRDAAQKIVDEFAGKSFPGYSVGKVERDGYRGQPIYTASLTGNDSRFEIQVDAIDGRVLGVYPIEE